MPIYEYTCASCDERSEFIQKVDSPPERECPKCGELKLEKVISLSSFQLKGTGWYETDFKNKSGD
jgi:putative FmdB family regulatory protein